MEKIKEIRKKADNTEGEIILKIGNKMYIEDKEYEIIEFWPMKDTDKLIYQEKEKVMMHLRRI